MSSNVKFDIAPLEGQPTRRDLKPGTIFTYSDNVGHLSAKQLYVVPEPAFSRVSGIEEKDIVVGGTHSGSLDDWHPSLPVLIVDLTVTRAAAQAVQ